MPRKASVESNKTPTVRAPRFGTYEVDPKVIPTVQNAMTYEQRRDQLRGHLHGVYAIQQLRIRIGLMLVAAFKIANGIKPSTPEEEAEDEKQKMLEQMRKDYAKITDAVVARSKSTPRNPVKATNFIAHGMFSDYTQYVMFHAYLDAEHQEQNILSLLESMLSGLPIYDSYLSKIPGIAELSSAILIANLDAATSPYLASMWRYCGLDVVQVVDETGAPKLNADGVQVTEGRRKLKSHMRMVQLRPDEEPVKTLGYQPLLKAKVLLIASNFLRCGNAHFTGIYNNIKHRYTNRPDLIRDTPKENFKARVHRMALRYTAKIFLKEYYYVSRALRNLPQPPDYAHDKLGYEYHSFSPWANEALILHAHEPRIFANR